MLNRLVVMARPPCSPQLSSLPAPHPRRSPPRRAAGPLARLRHLPLKSGLDLTGFDRNVRPQDDLYRFVGRHAGSRKPRFPPDRSNYGSFIILDDQAQEEVKQLIVAASEQPNRPPGSDAQKVGDFYLAYMDTARIESLGSRAAQGRARAHRRDRDAARRRALHRLFAAHRRRAAVRMVLGARQQELDRLHRLALPERAHDARPRLLPVARREVRGSSARSSRSTSSSMLARAGERDAQSAAARIAALETRIANYQWTKVQNRDPVKTYNPMIAARVPETRAGLRLARVLRRNGRAARRSST